jgi:hypothetical protein
MVKADSQEFFDEETQTMAKAHRLTIPLQYQQGLMPVVVEKLPILNGNGMLTGYHYVHGNVMVEEGIEQCLAPNTSIGRDEYPKDQWHDMRNHLIEVMDRKGRLDGVTKPLQEARQDARIARKAYNLHCNTTISIGSWDPSTGNVWEKYPIMSELDKAVMPRRPVYLATLDRMNRQKPSVESLKELNRLGQYQAKVIMNFEVEELEHQEYMKSIQTPEEYQDQEIKWGKKVKRVKARRNKLRNELIDLQKKAKRLNPGVNVRWYPINEDDKDFPIINAIQDHEYYKARGQAAQVLAGTEKVYSFKFGTTKSAHPVDDPWIVERLSDLKN